MKAPKIVLPDTINDQLLAEANRQNVDPATLCSSLVAEYFLEQGRKTEMVSSAERSVLTTLPSKVFDVRRNFPNFPGTSVELAQQFVDEALRLPGTRAFKAFSGRGIGLVPNFVFVEYLLKRHPGGIGVSFYGSPDSLQHHSLRRGRNPNYSRSTAYNQEQLEPLLKLIRRSHQLKFGRP